MGIGIHGANTRTEGGIVYIKKVETEDRREASAMASEFRRVGAKVKVVPNPHKEVFEIWVGAGADARLSGIDPRRQRADVEEGEIE